RFGAAVIELEVRPAVCIRIQARNLEGASEGCAEVVLPKLRLRDRHVGPQLVRRTVERRAAEGVRDRSLVWILAACTAATEHEGASAAWPSATPVPGTSTARRTPFPAARAAYTGRARGRSKAAGKL